MQSREDFLAMRRKQFGGKKDDSMFDSDYLLKLN